MDSDYLGVAGNELNLEQAMRAHEKERTMGSRPIKDADKEKVSAELPEEETPTSEDEWRKGGDG